ncbi:a-factor receptor [Ceratobasidium sp. 395]|nr:a-factor receptor [Ceratobasidium sp. 395]
MVVVALYHVVQVCRYAIIEDIGCWSYFSTTLLIIPMLLGWPVLLAAISFVYASLTIRAFIKTRRQFSQVLSDSGSNLSMSRYFRLMALAGTDMTFSLPLSLYFMITSMVTYHMNPWVSWENTHKYVHEVWRISYEELVSDPHTKSTLDITKWSVPGCAFLFFAYFGLSGEAVRQYKSIFWRVAAPFGLKPPAPRPERQDSGWSRRLVARITGSDPGATFPTTHTDLEVGQTAATDSATHPDSKQELVLQQKAYETELKQTEA